MTSSDGNIFRVTGHLCGEFTGLRWIPRTKASDADIFFDLSLNKRLSKQSWGWCFETPSCPLWRQCSVWDVEMILGILNGSHAIGPQLFVNFLSHDVQCHLSYASMVVIYGKGHVIYKIDQSFVRDYLPTLSLSPTGKLQCFGLFWKSINRLHLGNISYHARSKHLCEAE